MVRRVLERWQQYIPTRFSTNNVRLSCELGLLLPSDFAVEKEPEAGARCVAHSVDRVVEVNGKQFEADSGLRLFQAGIGALELIMSSSSASITLLERRVFVEPLEGAGDVSALLLWPLSDNGDKSVRVSDVDSSDALDNVECGT